MSLETERQIDIGLDLCVPYAQVVDLLGADPLVFVSPAVSEVRHPAGGTTNALSGGGRLAH
jgi:hypothetical protein